MRDDYIMPGTVRTIVAEVIAVLPEHHQAVADHGGYHYAITRKTPGVLWSDLKEGDMVTMNIYPYLPLVKEVINVNP